MPALRPARLVAIVAVLLVPVLGAQVQVPTASDPPRYVLPPRNVVDAFDAESLPQTLVSPNHQVVALTKARAYPSIAELSQPMLRLAGARVNPKTNGPHRDSGLAGTGIYSIALQKIGGGAETTVTVPQTAKISHITFSPDGSKMAFLNTKETAIELWVADTSTGAARLVSGSDRINATAANPCEWVRDNVTVICETVPAGRGAAPAEPTVPSGPNVQENYGKAAPAPTYEDLLKIVHDDQLFEYYFTSQLVAVNTTTGAKAALGKPAVFESLSPSPDGQYVLVARIKKPYSHLVPKNGFPQDIEIWSR